MGESGFNTNEVKCTCGDTFDNVGELISHANSVHGVEVE